ncbi:MAG: hypothetical protein US54_C0051G0003 [Candidatus Roizmanbacteria bacterium GW2011_GWA2_37_7]|uniref:Uncharacterized protein n=1 Tax=Candidatus Roizmanbacteria bacterium GW2011_GWA2_37_7 TaxID=1618481 RepID=A0A0G0H404_9BACT|nr:MAG: hypothetical protein US54_C0051G0003 [Candidatus Roizmanbacteria bacterium GW2011_GWA2_37_7]
MFPSFRKLLITLLFFVLFVFFPISIRAGDFCNCAKDDHGYSGTIILGGRVVTDIGPGKWISWQDANAPLRAEADCTEGGATLADGGFTVCPSSSGLRLELIDDCNVSYKYLDDFNFDPKAHWSSPTCDNSYLTVKLENIDPDHQCAAIFSNGISYTPDANCQVIIPDAGDNIWVILKRRDIDPIRIHEPTINCETMPGWACDEDAFTKALDVKIYDGNPATGGIQVGTKLANQFHTDAGAQCNGNTDHGFAWKIPDSLKDETPHDIYIRAVSVDESGNPTANEAALTNTPRTIRCVPPWYKLNGASLYKNDAINNYIPIAVQPYDPSDTSDRFLIVRGTNPTSWEGVAISGSNISLGTGAQSSTSEWERQFYTRSTGYLGNLNSFIEYVRLRKKFKIISSLADMESDTINIFTGVLPPITDPGDINGSINNAVLLVNGDIILNTPLNVFNPSNNSLALIATGNINIHSNVREIHGIFIASQIDIAYDVSHTTQELKVIGNLIGTNDIDALGLKRDRTDWEKPSLFIEFDQQMYVDLLLHLSTIVQEGRQLR